MRGGGAFKFSSDVESSAHKRQEGLCALCGKSVAWSHSPSHPVYAVQHSDGAGSSWKKEVDNCVILCNGCYMWTHDEGEHAVTAPTLPEEFKFSHGHSTGDHKLWANRLMGR